MSVSTAAVEQRKQVASERHVLVIDDGNRRAISLDAAAYTMGRDPSNAILLSSSTISRRHAMLLRLPIPGENRYRYRLIDGDAKGKPSVNGIFINQQRCSSHELVNGDTLSFGRKIRASYLTVTMAEAEFTKYLESIEFYRFKPNLVNPEATCLYPVDPPPAQEQIQTPAAAHPPVILDAKGTIYEAIDTHNRQLPIGSDGKSLAVRYRLGMIAASVLAILGLGVCLTMAGTKSQVKKSAMLIPAFRAVLLLHAQENLL